MVWIPVVVVVVALLVAAVVLLRRSATTDSRAPSTSPRAPHRVVAVEGVARVQLDLTAADPTAPAVQRLAQATAERVLLESSDVQQVVVEDIQGTHLARVDRRPPSMGRPPTAPGGGPVTRPHRHGSWTPPEVVPGVADTPVHRAIADRLDLDPAVRAAIQDPDSAVDVVRAVLEHAGLPVEVHGSVVRSGDHAVIVVDALGVPAATTLTRAFLAFRDSGASDAIVIHLSWVDPRELARRSATAPEVRHVGPEALQELADAVALGVDPFAVVSSIG